LLAGRIGHLMGTTGASVISRVMGIILATVAVDATLGGLDALDILNIAPVEDAPLSAE
jgi:multiple antibiotic resistance protein